jgi:phenylalanyl-tRNA synthetase beta chain
MNPITAEMSVMRTSLWPGLLNVMLYNQNRQQPRVRIFETGLQFLLQESSLIQQNVISGLVSGTDTPEQWGIRNREVDFFDLKGVLENVIKLTLSEDEFSFKPEQNIALHPGQTAGIYRADQCVGVLGALHPNIKQALDLQGNIFVFELNLDALTPASLPRYKEVSKFPEIRRDIAILVNDAVPAQRIQDTIKEVTGELLHDINVFDIYQGKGIAPNHKSVALGLTLQHASRTLRDEEVADLMERVITALKDQFAAELRS